MKNNQRKYIEYVRNYAESTGNHVWLGGSFLRGNPTPFSDVDISALMGKDSLREFISGYGDPVYLSYTTNPEGIIIVIYEDGVAVDLEVIESVDVTDDAYFHPESIKDHEYHRNSTVCREICQRSDSAYQTARLFHRSLIKYLSGKKEVGVSVANEIASFLDSAFAVTENDYKAGITRLLDLYCEKYPMDAKYRDLCSELINSIKPGIILITGASHAGKTVLAQKLLKKYGYPYLSIDHLKMGLIRSGNTDLTPEDDDKLTSYLWPIVREMIKTAIENHQNLIVEGCYVPFDWRKDFDEVYLSDIDFICLAFTEEYIRENFETIRQHASDIENRLDDSYCTIERLIEDNHKFAEGFESAGEKVLLVNGDYEKIIGEFC